jgi:tetratricopeptide (TPR) repeat protein
MIAWADKLWPLAEKSGAADAKQTEDYADFCAYTAARQLTDPAAKIAVFERLDSHKSTSEILHNLPADFFEAYQQLGDADKAGAMAQRALAADPENVEMLLAVAEYQFHKGSPKARPEIVAHTTKAVDILLKKPHPPQWTDADWEKKKSQMLGLAYYLGGISASMLNNWAKADQMLRGAVPLIHDNGAQESAVLYHLGMANYRLAEAGTDRTRPVDAVKFLRRCATIKGPYQDQAAKYVESIRSEYSLP